MAPIIEKLQIQNISNVKEGDEPDRYVPKRETLPENHTEVERSKEIDHLKERMQ